MTESKKKFTLTAVVFRNIFIGLLVVLLLLAGTGAVLGLKQLQSTAEDVQAVVSQASTIDQTNSRTIALWNKLQQDRQAVERVGQVVAESKSYAYQDVIVRDLRNFARKAGITITNYDFTVGGESGNTPTTTPQAPADATADIDAGEAAPDDAAAPGAEAASPQSTLKTTSVSVTIETPVDYRRLLRFVHYIEQNLTKMQISEVSLSRSSTDNKNAVTSDALTIEVYIK